MNLAQLDMLYSLKKIVILQSYSLDNSYLSTAATLFCPQGGRCRELRP